MLKGAEKEKDVLEIPDTVALMDLSEKEKQAMEVVSKAVYSACNVYDAVFSDPEDPYEVSVDEELLESKHLLLCNLFNNVRRLSELENTSRVVFETCRKVDFCDLAKRLTRLGDNKNVIFCASVCFMLRNTFVFWVEEGGER